MTPKEFVALARDAKHDALGLANDISPENYSWEQLVAALEKIHDKYPAVYKHFFFAELDLEAYNSIEVKRPVLELIIDEE